MPKKKPKKKPKSVEPKPTWTCTKCESLNAYDEDKCPYCGYYDDGFNQDPQEWYGEDQ